MAESGTQPKGTARSSLLEEVFDHLPVAVGVWSLPEGVTDPGALTLVAMNRFAETFATANQRAGMTMDEMLSRDAIARIGPKLVDAIEYGRAYVEQGDHEFLAPDGGVVWFTSQVVPLSGRAAALLSWDVTTRHAAAEEARLYQALADAAPIGISVWRLEDVDDPGSFVLQGANAEAERMAGVPLSPMFGRRMDVLAPDTVKSGRAAVYRDVVLGRAASGGGEVVVRSPKGVELAILTRAVALPDRRLGLSTQDVSALRTRL